MTILIFIILLSGIAWKIYVKLFYRKLNTIIDTGNQNNKITFIGKKLATISKRYSFEGFYELQPFRSITKYSLYELKNKKYMLIIKYRKINRSKQVYNTSEMFDNDNELLDYISSRLSDSDANYLFFKSNLLLWLKIRKKLHKLQSLKTNESFIAAFSPIRNSLFEKGIE